MKRFTVVWVVVIVWALSAPTASYAFHWWWSGGPAPGMVHLNKGHIPGISFYNNAVNGSATPLEHARGVWSANWAYDIYNLTSQSADIVAWDGYWGTTTWRGQTTLWGAWDGTHIQQMGVQLNRSLLPDYVQQRKTACHELGHASGGMLHDESRVGCMFSGAANPNIVAERTPSQHDFDHVQHLWAGLH